MIASFPQYLKRAADGFDPSVVATFLYDMAKTFSHYYHDNRILNAESEALITARVTLCEIVLQTMKNGFEVIGVPFLEAM